MARVCVMCRFELSTVWFEGAIDGTCHNRLSPLTAASLPLSLGYWSHLSSQWTRPVPRAVSVTRPRVSGLEAIQF